MTKIEISLLGSWQIAQLAGPTKKELRRKEQGLLAYLAVESSQTHSRDSLIGLFWPDLPPADARNNLRVALSRLKRNFGDSNILETTRYTIRMNPDSPVWLDVGQFLALIDQTEAHDHRSVAACQPCQDQLKQAVDLYRGEFLTGFFLEDCLAFEEWLFVWRERLHVQVLKQLDQLVQTGEDNGRYPDAEEYARRAIELDPLQESAHRQLMRALYAQGQRSAALSQFQIGETVLRDELGVEPEAETVRLRQEIQAETLKISTPIMASSQVIRHALPEITTPFVGRERELEQLSQRLTERNYRLITLVGPGGIGKTRLAIQAARAQRDAFRDGIYFVPLEGVQKASEIPAAIAEVMGITFTANAMSPQTELFQLLQSKQLLLVIDNLEHVIEEGADFLLTLLRTAPDVVLLVTSRERLNAQMEDLFRLRGLPYPDVFDAGTAVHFAAVRLFADRAHRLSKRFLLNGDTLPHVVRICHLVEGLPLGLELAATWIRDFTAKQIADAIETNLDLLETDLRDMPPRHQSIQAVFDYSWKQLSDAEKQILPLLTLFKGGFSLAAAKTITGASPIILTRLRYKSLLRSEGNGRYSFHELLRQIAAQKLPESIQSIQANYFRFYFQLLQEKTPLLKGYGAREASHSLMMEIDNIRQAWQWGIDAQSFADLQISVPSLADFYTYNGLYSEGIALIDNVLQQLPEDEEGKRPFFLIEKARLVSVIEGLAQIQQLIDQILTTTTNLTHYQAVRARAYYYLSEALFVKSIDSKASLNYTQQAMALAKQLDDIELIAQLFNQLGSLYYRFEQTEEALQEINKALSLYESIGNIKGIAQAYDKLGMTYSESGHAIKSLEIDNKLLDIYLKMGSELEIANQKYSLAVSLSHLGAYLKANLLLKKALEIFYKYNHEIRFQNSYIILGENTYCLGEDEMSIDYFRQGIQLQEKLQLRSRLCNDLTAFSLPLRRTGSLDEAQQILEKAIEVSVAPRYKLQAEAHLACVFLDQGKKEDAFTLAKTVWEEVEIDEGRSLPDALRTLSHLYEVFDALEQPRFTQSVLALAFNEAQHVIHHLTDPEILADYLKYEPNLQFFLPEFAQQGYVLPV